MMKLTTLLLLLTMLVCADQTAVTDNGDIVILRTDGTWEYQDVFSKAGDEIPVNKKRFKKSSSAIFALKSKENKAAFWLDTQKWTFEKGSGPIEYSLDLKKGDLYAMIVTERIPISLEALPKIALANARKASADIQIVKQEYRKVNGLTVIYLVMEGTVETIPFRYAGYYYSDESGTTQLIAYTAIDLADEYKEEIEELLNGFDVQE